MRGPDKERKEERRCAEILLAACQLQPRPDFQIEGGEEMRKPLKEFKVLISIHAHNSDDMEEQLSVLDCYEIEWWAEVK